MEDAAQATIEKKHGKELKVATVKQFNEYRAKLIHQRDDISLAMAEGNKHLSKIFQPDLFYDDALKKKGQLQSELQQ